MKIKHFLLPAILVMLLSAPVFSQVSVTSYSIYALGVNSSHAKKASFELRAFANRDFADVALEADVYYNFQQAEYHQFSLGAGLNTVPFSGGDVLNAITVPAQLEIWPLQDFKRLSLVFELAPEFVLENDVRLRTLWGFRYHFGK